MSKLYDYSKQHPCLLLNAKIMSRVAEESRKTKGIRNDKHEEIGRHRNNRMSKSRQGKGQPRRRDRKNVYIYIYIHTHIYIYREREKYVYMSTYTVYIIHSMYI